MDSFKSFLDERFWDVEVFKANGLGARHVQRFQSIYPIK